MKKNVKNKNIYNALEKIKWLFASLCFILIYSINYYLYEIQFFIRILIIFFLIILSTSIILSTKIGKYMLLYISTTKNEIRKITWPQYKETLYTACIIIIVTILISLLLWGLDNIIFHLIAFIVSLRF